MTYPEHDETGGAIVSGMCLFAGVVILMLLGLLDIWF